MNICTFLDELYSAPTSMHLISLFRSILLKKGYVEIAEMNDISEIPRQFFVIRESRALIAGNIFDNSKGIIVTCSSDMPSMKVIMDSLHVEDGLEVVKTELNGDAQWWSWINRDLRMAGRVDFINGGKVESKLISTGYPVAVIPALAIHLTKGSSMNTKHTNGELSTAIIGINEDNDLSHSHISRIIEKELGFTPEKIINYELYLMDFEAPVYCGNKSSFITGQGISSVGSSIVAFRSFLKSDQPKVGMKLFCTFEKHNNDCKSTRAESNFLENVLQRIGCSPLFSRNSILISSEYVHPESEGTFNKDLSPPFYIEAKNAKIKPKSSRIIYLSGETTSSVLSRKLGMKYFEYGIKVSSLNSIKENADKIAIIGALKYLEVCYNSIENLKN